MQRQYCIVLNGILFIVWYCVVVWGIVWYCTALYGITRYCMVVHGIVWHGCMVYGICVVLYGALHCIILQDIC